MPLMFFIQFETEKSSGNLVFFDTLPVRTTIPYSAGTFFITFTCKDWLPLIEEVKGYDLLYNWFYNLKNNGHFVNGFVIMPNHVHTLLTFTDSPIKINTVIGNAKRFMAYEIIKRIGQSRNHDLLKRLNNSVKASGVRKNKLHNVWENSFDWKYCESDYFKYQKLDYIHTNPCTGKWNLSSNPEAYIHSSAAFYSTGIPGIFPVDHLEKMKDLPIHKPQRLTPQREDVEEK